MQGAGPRPRKMIGFAHPRPRRCCTTQNLVTAAICAAAPGARMRNRSCFSADARFAGGGPRHGVPGTCERFVRAPTAGAGASQDDARVRTPEPADGEGREADELLATGDAAGAQPHLVSVRTASAGHGRERTGGPITLFLGAACSRCGPGDGFGCGAAAAALTRARSIATLRARMLGSGPAPSFDGA